MLELSLSTTIDFMAENRHSRCSPTAPASATRQAATAHCVAHKPNNACPPTLRPYYATGIRSHSPYPGKGHSLALLNFWIRPSFDQAAWGRESALKIGSWPQQRSSVRVSMYKL